MKIKNGWTSVPKKSGFTAVCIIACCLFSTAYSFSQGTWTQKANFGGSARTFAVGFSIGTKGYAGTGGYQKDFWEWDQATDTWTQKADFGGSPRIGAVGFSIGTKGYIGTGNYTKDFWEWDQATNVWTQKANFAGAARTSAKGFSIGNFGYIGTGWTGNGPPLTDLWEWDQAANTWTKKANCGGLGRSQGVGFSIGDKGYFGTGSGAGVTPSADFWEWNQATNVWTQKANFGGGIRYVAEGFSIGKKGYVGMGEDVTAFKQDFWEWDQATNTWTQQTNFGGGLRAISFGFSIDCKGYVGAGYAPAGYFNDFWEFTPQNPCDLLFVNTSSQNVLCNGQCTGSSTINPYGGIDPYTYTWSNGQTMQTITGLCAGTYTAMVIDSINNSATAIITITQPTSLSLSASSTQTNCSANTGTANANASGGTSAYTYNWSNGQTTQTANNLGSGIYMVTVTDANGCTQTQTVSVVQSPGPTAVATATPGSVFLGGSTTLSASGGNSYEWIPSTGLSCTTCANPAAIPQQTTVYCVIVTDANNCTDSACITIHVEIDCSTAEELYLPNAFSPNGDGENDVLKLYYGNPQCIKTFKFIIYDRWGEKVFETKNPIAEWNGYYKGKIQNTAVFVYYLEATLISGEEIIRKGNTSLIR